MLLPLVDCSECSSYTPPHAWTPNRLGLAFMVRAAVGIYSQVQDICHCWGGAPHD